MRKVKSENIQAVRAFNRLYSQSMGLLDKHLYGSAYGLMEGRVIYEIAQSDEEKRQDDTADRVTAAALIKRLNVDAGYLSRILRKFEKVGLITRTPAPHDGRVSELALTLVGQTTAEMMTDLSNFDVAKRLNHLTPDQADDLVQAMQKIEDLLNPEDQKPAPIIIGPHSVGDLGWVLERHCTLYARDQGWNSGVEPVTAQIIADFSAAYEADAQGSRSCCFIARIKGERVGSIFLVKEDDNTARIRLVLVDPAARGRGVGSQLVESALSFARSQGYGRVVLWTNAVLTSARKIYEAAGFELIKAEMHTTFGEPMLGHSYELTL